MRIPFNRPFIPPNAGEFMQRSLRSGHLSGDGPESAFSVELLEQVAGPGRYFLTPSCTHALEMACRLLELTSGDEVIMPSYNFTSAATAVALCGATPVFVDIDDRDLNMDVEHVEAAISSRTRAIIVLHYAGVAAKMPDLVKLAEAHKIPIIEDAAHSLGVETDWGTIGSWGAMATYSFHETKNIQCGEGGALRINDVALCERAEILREKGTNRARFFLGEVDKYSWVDHGSSWLLSDLSASLLAAQLLSHSWIQMRRGAIWSRYLEGSRQTCERLGLLGPFQPPGQSNAHHMFYLRAPSLQVRQDLIAHLKKADVVAAFHYQALHSSKAGIKLGRSAGCSISTRVSDTLVRLPLYPDLDDDGVDQVLAALDEYVPSCDS